MSLTNAGLVIEPNMSHAWLFVALSKAPCLSATRRTAILQVSTPSTVGTYVAVVAYTDGNQDQATYWTRVGKNATEWSQNPLAGFSDLSVLPDKANYTAGGICCS